jgi:hypothetical protein
MHGSIEGGGPTVKVRATTVLILAAFVAVVVATCARFDDRAGGAPEAIAVATNWAVETPTGGTAGASPTREDVRSQFHVDVERLRMRVEKAPHDSTLLITLARLLQGAHRPTEAASYYERYVALIPSDRHAAVAQWEEAKGAMLSLLEVIPDNPAAMYNLGAIDANLGNYQEATAWWRRVSEGGADEALAVKATESLRRISTHGN